MKLGRVLPRSFYARDVLEVARALLGKALVHESPEGTVAGRIVEVEAYRGPEDRAAHSYGGRRTARTEVMFGPPGHAYVFFVYGMHFHFNVVTGAEEEPHAVLVRAVEPLVGRALMAARRQLPETRRELTNGPGKLCRAFAIDRAHYGADLCAGPLHLRALSGFEPLAVGTSPRIGVDYAGEWRDEPWRFFDAGSAYVSPVRASTKARTGSRSR